MTTPAGSAGRPSARRTDPRRASSGRAPRRCGQPGDISSSRVRGARATSVCDPVLESAARRWCGEREVVRIGAHHEASRGDVPASGVADWCAQRQRDSCDQRGDAAHGSAEDIQHASLGRALPAGRPSRCPAPPGRRSGIARVEFAGRRRRPAHPPIAGEHRDVLLAVGAAIGDRLADRRRSAVRALPQFRRPVLARRPP